eukprot:s1546_g4.t1
MLHTWARTNLDDFRRQTPSVGQTTDHIILGRPTRPLTCHRTKVTPTGRRLSRIVVCDIRLFAALPLPLLYQAMSETSPLAEASPAPSYDATPTTETNPQSRPARSTQQERRNCFPLEPFSLLKELLPTCYYSYLPSYVRQVHSFPHLVLLTGMVANCSLFIQLVLTWKYWEEEKHAPWDYTVVIASCIFAVVSLQLLHMELVQYSVDLHTCSTEAQKSKDQMMNTFNGMVSDLDTMLAKSADTQAALAERSLDSHRRDLANFLLKGIVSKVRSFRDFPTPDFLAFLLLYLKIFEECSAYPLEEPFVIASEDEVMETGAAIIDTVEMVGKKAKATEVKFLKKKVDTAKKSSSTLRQKWKRATFVPKKVMSLTGFSKLVKVVKKKKKPQESKKEELKEEEQEFEFTLPAAFDSDMTKEQEIKWLRFDMNGRFQIEMEDDDPFPVQMKLFLFSCTVLSPEHARLLFSFFIGVPLLVLNIVVVSPPYTVVISSMSVTLICIAFVLHDFLDIDAIQRMEIQIKEMQATVAAVEERRQQMVDFFGRVHRLADFWLHRTLPRLELMKLCGDALEDAEEPEMEPLLVEIVTKVRKLEDSLLPISLWQKEGLKEADKKKRSELLSKLTSRACAKYALQEMPAVAQELLDLKRAALESEANDATDEAPQ